MDDVNSPLNVFTSDMEMDIDEANALSSGFDHRNPILIDSGDDDGDESDTTLLGDDFSEPRVVTPVSEARENERLRDDHPILETHSCSGRTLRPGKTVELTDGTFVRIVSILEDRRTNEISLKGFLFQRAVKLAGMLPLKRNEVAMIMKIDKDDPRDVLKQSIELFQLSSVVKIRELVKTNQQYPGLSFCEIDPDSIELGKDYMNDHCRLVCRWNYLKINKNEGFLRRITDVESDEGCSVPQYQLRHAHRGPTIKGGDSTGWLDSEKAFDRKERMRCFCIDPFGFHSDSIDTPGNRRQQRRYTFGDGFCGAGGASRGAYGAGFRVEWGFDHDPHAITTYCENFPHARCDGIAVNDFVTAINEEYKIDVLHLSPPCQTFSPAHTRPGPNDERNQATFLATEELIKKTRPRIVTLEETFGLTRTSDNLKWFNAMLQMFTRLGFSVRWKVFNFWDFGLPQPRRRLFLFASCPGETLPDFPEPTHCRPEDCARFPHRSKFTTVNDAIGRIPRNFPNHNPHAMLKLKRPRPRYSGNLPLGNTITCGGSMNSHPSGTRCFTDRELACLQGFPLEHHFGPRGVKKQIGNAVPPVVAKVFFQQIIRALRIADGL